MGCKIMHGKLGHINEEVVAYHDEWGQLRIWYLFIAISRGKSSKLLAGQQEPRLRAIGIMWGVSWVVYPASVRVTSPHLLRSRGYVLVKPSLSIMSSMLLLTVKLHWHVCILLFLLFWKFSSYVAICWELLFLVTVQSTNLLIHGIPPIHT